MIDHKIYVQKALGAFILSLSLNLNAAPANWTNGDPTKPLDLTDPFNWDSGCVPCTSCVTCPGFDSAQFNNNNPPFFTVPPFTPYLPLGTTFDVLEVTFTDIVSYNFFISGLGTTFIVDGPGVNNTGQAFNIFQINNSASFNFNNSASGDVAASGNIYYEATNAGVVNFNDSSNASNASISLTNSNLNFSGAASAQNAIITAERLPTLGNSIQFNDSSTAGSSSIGISRLSTLDFADSASAGTSYVNSVDGHITFSDTTDAAQSTIDALSKSELIFANAATANTSQINLSNSSLEFGNTSTAASATIVAQGSSRIDFSQTASAAQADIAVELSLLNFLESSTAGTSSIVLSARSDLEFKDSSTAGSAIILADHSTLGFVSNSNAGNATFNLINSDMSFIDTSSAQTATINLDLLASLTLRENTTLSNALVNLSEGSTLEMIDTSSAGNATLVANRSSIEVSEDSTLATAQITMLNDSTLTFKLNGDAASSTVGLNNGSIFFTNQTTANQGQFTITDSSAQFSDNATAATATFNLNSISYLDFINESTAASATFNLAGSNCKFTELATISDATFNLTSNSILLLNNYEAAFAPTINLDATSSFVISQLFDTAFSGQLLGTGTILKQGEFTLSFLPSTQAASFNGNTLVNGGRLNLNTQLGGNVSVALQGILSGTGTVKGNVTVTDGGIIRPGNSIGTLNIEGNYVQNQNTTYQVQINGPGASSLINVAGTAALNGGTVLVSPVNGLYSVNQKYTILHADGGLTGTFANVLGPQGITQNILFQPLLTYDPNNAFLTIQTAVINAAQTCEQQSVARQIDNFVFPSPDVLLILSSFSNMCTDEISAALELMKGPLYTSSFIPSEIANRQFLRRIYDPLRPIITTWPCCETCCEDSCDCPSKLCSQFDFWFEGGGQRSFFHDHKHGGGFKTQGYEIAGGAQVTSNDLNLTLGLAGGYTLDHLHYHLRGTGKNETTLAGVYALYRPERFYILADGTFSYSHNRVRRHIRFGEIDRIARSKPKIWQGTFYGEVGIDMCCECLLIQPFIGIEFNYAKRDRIVEHGAQALNLVIFQQHRYNTDGRLGVHLTSTQMPANLVLYVDLAWQVALTSCHKHNHERFADFGSSFEIRGVTRNWNGFEGSVNLSTTICDNWRLYAEISGERWSHASDFTLLGGIETSW